MLLYRTLSVYTINYSLWKKKLYRIFLNVIATGEFQKADHVTLMLWDSRTLDANLLYK